MGNRPICCGRACPSTGFGPGDPPHLLEAAYGCDPAGAVFHETLEELSEVDRLLLLYAGSPNLVAVRWLTALGANAVAVDIRGTTCLHAACRSGSLAVLRHFLSEGLDHGAADASGWTPLHVAAFMGRSRVALQLLESGANGDTETAQGQTAADLCNDASLRDVLKAWSSYARNGVSTPKLSNMLESSRTDVQVSGGVRFEPFFVPRPAFLRDAKQSTQLQEIGLEIFSERPGQGMAYLVAMGVLGDFPIELSGFLMSNEVSRKRVGEFLGEDFSLAQTLRLEFINALRLLNTGVISCLMRVFGQLQMPTDLMKIDRLVGTTAHIWWRQHENLGPVSSEQLPAGDAEVEGRALMRHLLHHGALHQLMLSTVLLHSNFHAPDFAAQRLSLDQWLAMNQGIEGSAATDAMREIQRRIYNIVSRGTIRQFQIWDTQALEADFSPRLTSKHSRSTKNGDWAVQAKCTEGWAHLPGHGFPRPGGSKQSNRRGPKYVSLRGLLCESSVGAASRVVKTASPVCSRRDTSADMTDPLAIAAHPDLALDDANCGTACSGFGSAWAAQKSPAAGHRRAAAFGENGTEGPDDATSEDAFQSMELVWLVLREGQLFFAPRPKNWAPYACLPLGPTTAFSRSRSSLTFTLKGVYPMAGSIPMVNTLVPPPPLKLIFLLPDGRWQVLELASLEVQLSNPDEFQTWTSALLDHCRPDPSDAPATPRQSAKATPPW